jgi:hypothetical protein
MMRVLLLALSMLVAVPVAGYAKTFKLGDDKAVANITIPDSWGPNEITDGVEGTSKDGETYVAAEVVAVKDVESALVAGLKFLQKGGVKFDPSKLQKKEGKMSGYDAVSLEGEGTDKDGPTNVSLTLVVISNENMILLTYWGTAEGEKSNAADLAAIASSIKALN